MFTFLNTVVNALVQRRNSAIIPPADDEIPEAHKVISEQNKPAAVNITIDRQIRTKYQSGWITKIRNQPITEVVIHGTAGGSETTNLLRWMYNGERGAEYMKGIALFHYLIGRDGEIIEIIDPAYYVYHSTSGAHDKQTIGIEMMNPDKMNASNYTDAQYQSLFKLIFDYLMKLYPTINRITSHRYNIIVYNHGKLSPKQCPGTGFVWAKLDEELQRRKYQYQTDGQLRYNITRA